MGSSGVLVYLSSVQFTGRPSASRTTCVAGAVAGRCDGGPDAAPREEALGAAAAAAAAAAAKPAQAESLPG